MKIFSLLTLQASTLHVFKYTGNSAFNC